MSHFATLYVSTLIVFMAFDAVSLGVVMHRNSTGGSRGLLARVPASEKVVADEPFITVPISK